MKLYLRHQPENHLQKLHLKRLYIRKDTGFKPAAPLPVNRLHLDKTIDLLIHADLSAKQFPEQVYL